MDIRTGPRRRPAPQITGPQAGLLYRWGIKLKDLVQTPDEIDQAAAEHGLRMAAFIKGDPVPNVWGEVLEPQFFKFRDQIVENIIGLKSDVPGATEELWRLKGELEAIEKWAKAIDKTIDLGAGAHERMAMKHLRLAAAGDAAREERKTG